MNPLLALIIGILLAACAGPTYYPAQPSGEGSYYIARSPGATTITPYDAAYGYGFVPVYGIYPWWSYSYYSPYFYPHHFSVWQAGWPYYAGGYWPWNGSYPYGYSLWGHHFHRPPQRYPPVPDAPGSASPIRPTAPPVTGPAATPRDLYGDRARWRDARRQAGFASAERGLRPAGSPSLTVPAAVPFEPSGAARSAPGRGRVAVPASPPPRDSTPHFRDGLGRIPSQRDP